ncbi:hypothetical protein DOY81_000903 [Sarcophaga bullata]|nr:hypothetical protein DOY81_000903 [Sarcophaga bullata]
MNSNILKNSFQTKFCFFFKQRRIEFLKKNALKMAKYSSKKSKNSLSLSIQIKSKTHADHSTKNKSKNKHIRREPKKKQETQKTCITTEFSAYFCFRK